MNSMKRQKDRILKEELCTLVADQYATGDHWRNNPEKKEEMEPQQKQHPVVDATCDGSKVQYCKEQYCMLLLLLLSRFSHVRLCVTP